MMFQKWLLRLAGLFVVQVLAGVLVVSGLAVVETKDPQYLPYIIAFCVMQFVLPVSAAMTLPGAAAAELLAILMLKGKSFSWWAVAYMSVGGVFGVLGGTAMLMLLPAGAGPVENFAFPVLLFGASGLVCGLGATFLWRSIHRVTA